MKNVQMNAMNYLKNASKETKNALYHVTGIIVRKFIAVQKQENLAIMHVLDCPA